MSKHNFDQRALGAAAHASMEMQNEFLNQFISKPRSVGITERPGDAAELIRMTYRRLLEQVRDAIEIELEELG